MSIEFACPSCGKSYRLKDKLAGKTARCTCGQQIKIPALPRGPEPASDLDELLDEIKRPSTQATKGPAAKHRDDSDLQNFGWEATGNRPLVPMNHWLKNTGSALVKLLIGAVVGGFIGLKVVAREKGAPAMEMSTRILMVLAVAIAGAGAGSLLIVSDVVRDRKTSGRRVPMLLRWYFAAGWLSAILWITTVFAAAILWLVVFAAIQ